MGRCGLVSLYCIIVHTNPVIVSDQVIEAHVLHLAASLRIIIVDEIRFEDLGRLGITFPELAQLGVAQESAFTLVRPHGIDPEWTSAFQDLRWVDLTALQHVLGMAASVVWLRVVMGRSVWPTFVHSRRKSICIAALGNLVGNLATNAAYASSTTQVVKACEPLYIVVLMALLYKNYEGLRHSTLMSVVIIVLGAATFIRSDSTLNICGLVAGMISNAAFSARKIYLKNLSNTWDSPLQKFAVISIYSVLFLLPVLLIKLIVNWELSTN